MTYETNGIARESSAGLRNSTPLLDALGLAIGKRSSPEQREDGIRRYIDLSKMQESEARAHLARLRRSIG